MSDESYDPDRVLARLMQEVRQCHFLLTTLKEVLYSDQRYEGLTLIGGFKAVLKDAREQRERIRELEREVDRLTKL